MTTSNATKVDLSALVAKQISALQRAGVERQKLTYEQVYFYPPMMSFHPVPPDFQATQRPIRNDKRETSLYVHIPFCTGHCTYCHYVTYTGYKRESLDAYLNTLEGEAAILKERGCFENRSCEIIHVGGGTPTFLEKDQISRVVEFCRRVMPIEPKAEITWESSPETIVDSGAEKLSLLRRAGVNRLSMGIESFEDHILKACGRRYRTDVALNSYAEARDRGFTNINLDMIYGLADQTLDDWKRTLDIVVELQPDCVTTYHLRMKPGTPMASFSISRFPAEEICRDMQIATINRLTDAGYTQVMGNQFVLDRNKSYRYEVEKWKDDRDIIGIGVSGYSYIDGWAYYNIRSLPEYADCVSSGNLPISLQRRLSPAQRAARMIVLGLRVVPDGVDKQLFFQKFGKALDAMFGTTVHLLEGLELIENTAERIRLTSLGVLFCDEVCIEFYAEEDKEQLRRVNASKYGLYLDCPDHLTKKRANAASASWT